MDWKIGRVGKKWTGPEGLEKLDRLPGRLELDRGTLCINAIERHNLLAGILENFGMDEIVQLGALEDWQQAIAARANDGQPPSAFVATAAPERHWNCRVIEFPSEDETWFTIHEVYYEHGFPVAYAASAADPGWSSDDGPQAGLDRLEKFREALRKPILKVGDFAVGRAKVELLNKLGRMIEESGSVWNRAELLDWLEGWLAEPLEELNGAAPVQVLGTEEGRCQLETILERMRGGLPA